MASFCSSTICQHSICLPPVWWALLRDAVGRLTEEMCSEAMEDIFDKATAAVEKLYHIRDTFFPVNPDDKTSKLRELSDLALKILDSIPPGRFCFHFSYAFHFSFSEFAYCNSSAWDLIILFWYWRKMLGKD